MSYISGGPPRQIGSVTARDVFTGNGSKTQFGLSQEVPASDPNSIFVFVNTVIKKGGVDYTLNDAYLISPGTITGTFTLDETVTIGSASGKLIQTSPQFVVVLTSGVFGISDTITGVSSGATSTVSDYVNKEGYCLKFISAPANSADIFVIHNTKLYYRRPPQVITSTITPVGQDVGTLWWEPNLKTLSVYESTGSNTYAWTGVTSSVLDAGSYPIVGSAPAKYQHLRNSTSGVKPLLSDISTGEIAVNLTDQKIYSKTTTNTIIPLANHTIVAPSAISNPDPGDTWFDTASDLFKIWNGSIWKQSGNFLPLSGGTLTGTLTLPRLVATDNTKSISTDSSSNFLSLYGGVSGGTDAYLKLRGSSTGINPGGFELGVGGQDTIVSDTSKNITITANNYTLKVGSTTTYTLDSTTKNHTFSVGSLFVSPSSADNTNALYILNNSNSASVNKNLYFIMQGKNTSNTILDVSYILSTSTDANWSGSLLKFYTRQSNTLTLSATINNSSQFLLNTSSAFDSNKLQVLGAATVSADSPTTYANSQLQIRSAVGDVSIGFNAATGTTSAAELMHPRGNDGRLRLYNSSRTSLGALELKTGEIDVLTLQSTYSTTSSTSGTINVDFTTKQIWYAGTLSGTSTFNLTFPSKSGRGFTIVYYNGGYATSWSGIKWRNGDPPSTSVGYYTISFLNLPSIGVFGSWLMHS